MSQWFQELIASGFEVFVAKPGGLQMEMADGDGQITLRASIAKTVSPSRTFQCAG
jgi:hypothetical protein